MWDWRATTLNPYYEGNNKGEMVGDDRLIRYTYPQWFFGRDGSGDITADGHVRDLCAHIRQVVKDEELPPLLVTADGSIDCQENPAEQESLLIRLHYCEMISACLILDKGGSFVLKVFTMFEPASVALLFLLNIMFAEVNAFKPATSKAGNSEIYLVCMNYRKNVREETLWKLIHLTVYSKTDGVVNFMKELPEDFMLEHRQFCERFAQWQLKTIRHNMDLFPTLGPYDLQKLESKQMLALEMFLERTHVSNARYYQRVANYARDESAFIIPNVSRGQLQAQIGVDWYHKNLKGTFHLRQNLNTMPWQDRVKLIDLRDNPQPYIVLECKHVLTDDEVVDWPENESGNVFSVIENSRLCLDGVMKDLNLFMKHSDFRSCRQPQSIEHTRHLGNTLAALIAGPSAIPHLSSTCLVYWVGSEEDANSLLYKSFLENIKGPSNVKFISTNEDFAKLANASALQIQVFCNVTSFCGDSFCCTSGTQFEELRAKRKFVSLISKLLKHMTKCQRLVLLTTTFLSRLNAGMLYILARSFHMTRICGESNLWLHQFVVLDNFLGTCPELLEHIAITERLTESEAPLGQPTVLEVVNFSHLVNDRKFVQFVTAYNNYIVTGFINLMLHHYLKSGTQS